MFLGMRICHEMGCQLNKTTNACPRCDAPTYASDHTSPHFQEVTITVRVSYENAAYAQVRLEQVKQELELMG